MSFQRTGLSSIARLRRSQLSRHRRVYIRHTSNAAAAWETRLAVPADARVDGVGAEI